MLGQEEVEFSTGPAEFEGHPWKQALPAFGSGQWNQKTGSLTGRGAWDVATVSQGEEVKLWMGNRHWNVKYRKRNLERRLRRYVSRGRRKIRGPFTGAKNVSRRKRGQKWQMVLGAGWARLQGPTW